MLGNQLDSTKQQTLIVDDTEITKPEDLGDAFNNFFSSIGDSTASCLNSDGNINKFNTMDTCGQSIFLRPASPTEVSNVIRVLNSSKATGVDGFPVSALKKYSDVLSPIICTSFNDSLTSGIYPDCLKKALVYRVSRRYCELYG